MKQTRLGHRGATAAALVVGGGALAVGTWLGGQHGLAVGLVVFYAVASVVAYLWAGKEMWPPSCGPGATSVREPIDRDATSITGFAISLAAIVGVVIESARHGNPGAFEVMCLVGGLIYAGGVFALGHRR